MLRNLQYLVTSRHCQRYPQSYGINNSTWLLHIRTVVVSDGRLTVHMAGKQFGRVHRSSTWAVNLTWPVKGTPFAKIFISAFCNIQPDYPPRAQEEKGQVSNIKTYCPPQWNCFIFCIYRLSAQFSLSIWLLSVPTLRHTAVKR